MLVLSRKDEESLFSRMNIKRRTGHFAAHLASHLEPKQIVGPFCQPPAFLFAYPLCILYQLILFLL